jgi:hypothetical protein
MQHQLFTVAVDDTLLRAIDARFQGVAHPAKIGRVISQRVDINQRLHTLHAGQMEMFDHLERALQKLDAYAERVQTKAGGLDQHHQVAGCELLERGEHSLRRNAVEGYEYCFWQAAPVGLRECDSEIALRIQDHDCGSRGGSVR